MRYESHAPCVLAVLFSTMAIAPAFSQQPPPIFSAPKRYYLALGDSVAFGYQASKARAGLPPSGFNTGYVDVFAARLRQIQPGITVVNYSCPGETATTMVAPDIWDNGSFFTGRCPWTLAGLPLHDGYSGSQSQAALSFLKVHPGEVSPITLTLWGNDIRNIVISCTTNDVVDFLCLQNRAPRAVAALASKLAEILQALRSEAPDAEIIVTGAWDSFIDAFAFADPLFQALNGLIADAAAANRARFADPFPIFNPQGDSNTELQAICTLTLLCTEFDSHPSDAGYRALAGLVFDVSQYVRLLA
jgi:lysophospholipase L1-like esterase